MSDYYISELNRTFFLSGSKIYSSEGTGSGVDKSNKTESTKDWFESNIYPYSEFNLVSMHRIVENVEATGSYILDNFASGSSVYSPGSS